MSVAQHRVHFQLIPVQLWRHAKNLISQAACRGLFPSLSELTISSRTPHLIFHKRSLHDFAHSWQKNSFSLKLTNRWYSPLHARLANRQGLYSFGLDLRILLGEISLPNEVVGRMDPRSFALLAHVHIYAIHAFKPESANGVGSTESARSTRVRLQEVLEGDVSPVRAIVKCSKSFHPSAKQSCTSNIRCVSSCQNSFLHTVSNVS